jgi:hypothetical protein
VKPLELLDISGMGVKVKEWDEGFEELRSIPHSFAFTFNDGSEAWSFYTDSEKEKVRLLTREPLLTIISSVQNVIIGLVSGI